MINENDDKESRKRVECQTCKKTFKEKWKLRRHEIIHNRKKQLKCSTCNKNFVLKRELKDHMAVDHDMPWHDISDEIENSIKMPETYNMDSDIVSTSFDSSLSFSKTSEFGLNSNQIPQSLDKSGFDLRNDRSMKNRSIDLQTSDVNQNLNDKILMNFESNVSSNVNSLSFRPNSESDFNSDDRLFDTQTENVEAIRQYKCQICKKTFKQKSGLRRHETIHNRKKTFECTMCNMTFTFKGELKNHMAIDHDVPRAWQFSLVCV